ncbi:unnamed protein product [Orchesella dallaii]|uniref:Uncharacterized protein n=1 Tax=Orchesella dallaii TaxID=48710 RepID=A0ABP1Q5S2_9HEXA
MANSRTLLVYVLALVLVCPNSFWVNAGSAPILSEYHHPQQAPIQHQPLQQPQHHQQLLHDNSVASPSSSQGVAAQQPSAPAALQQSSQKNAPPKMSIKNGWGLGAGTSKSGPYTSGYSYISGRTMESPPPYVYMTDNDLPEVPTGRTATMMNGIGSGLNGLFGNTFDWKSAAFGGAFTLLAQFMDFPGGLFSSLAPPVTRSTGGKGTSTGTEKVDKIVLTSSKDKDNASKGNGTTTILSRRKRSDEPDSDLTNLASMVLSAIQSGECMQKSICLLGSQIGASNKGRLAFTLVDKLIPEAVQGNQYFVTLKKALKSGDSFCDKFFCKLH